MAILRSSAALLASLLVVAGCPQLDSPLATVTGRIVGASAGAYAYPFSRPDLKVMATLPDGSFRIEGVPTSVGAIVLYDGTQRAERIAVELDGASDNRIADRFGTGAVVDDSLRMPLAGSVLAAAIPDGGAVPSGASYTMVGTDVVGIVQAPGADAIVLGPLPPGPLEVHVHRAGFLVRDVAVEALPGATVPLSIPLPIDEDAEEPGCGSGMECENGLHCNPADGRCYSCVSAADCGSGETCVTSLGLCKAAGAASAVCTACTADAECASNVCVIGAGEPAGYCSRPCSAAPGCPAGFACSADDRCVAPDGCADWLRTMGSPCLSDGDCADDLAGGWCQHPVGYPTAPGTCTAWCGIDQHCRIGTGTASTLVCTSNRCAPP
jgi:hypothetical protein